MSVCCTICDICDICDMCDGVKVGELRVGEVESDPMGFKVYSQIRPSHTYLILMRSEKVKQDWVEKIDEVIRSYAELMKKVNTHFDPFSICSTYR